jgi:hypothetical protein
MKQTIMNTWCVHIAPNELENMTLLSNGEYKTPRRDTVIVADFSPFLLLYSVISCVFSTGLLWLQFTRLLSIGALHDVLWGVIVADSSSLSPPRPHYALTLVPLQPFSKPAPLLLFILTHSASYVQPDCKLPLLY